jgi:hypothetical protein
MTDKEKIDALVEALEAIPMVLKLGASKEDIVEIVEAALKAAKEGK